MHVNKTGQIAAICALRKRPNRLRAIRSVRICLPYLWRQPELLSSNRVVPVQPRHQPGGEPAPVVGGLRPLAVADDRDGNAVVQHVIDVGQAGRREGHGTCVCVPVLAAVEGRN